MTNDRSAYLLPVAIVLAALLIAGAIFLSRGDTEEVAAPEESVGEITVRPVDENDHIRGNPNAPIILVEYSDYDCPFCSQFHETMQQVMEKYGTNGSVAWVYRHFPIEQLHPNADEIAAASECVAEIGGNDAFWTFADLVFAEKPIEERSGQQYLGLTDMSRLPEFAERAGVDKGRFELCANSGKYDEFIEASVTEAQEAGGRGTPHTILIAGNEVVGTVPGAFPFENFRGANGQMQSGMDELIGELVREAAARGSGTLVR